MRGARPCLPFDMLSDVAINLEKRTLMLVDNLGLALALGKGRCSSSIGLKICRERLAWSIFSNTQFIFRWVCSEHNPSDRPSRLTGTAVYFERIDMRQAEWNHEAAEAAAEAWRRHGRHELQQQIEHEAR